MRQPKTKRLQSAAPNTRSFRQPLTTRPFSGRPDLFRERPDAMINMSDPLVTLSKVIDWSRFDAAFGGFYRPFGRPAKPTRLMVGALSQARARSFGRGDSRALGGKSIWQYFCGFEFFQTEMPIDPSTMTRWRKRIGPDGLSEMLKARVDATLDTGTDKPSSQSASRWTRQCSPKRLPIRPMGGFAMAARRASFISDLGPGALPSIVPSYPAALASRREPPSSISARRQQASYLGCVLRLPQQPA